MSHLLFQDAWKSRQTSGAAGWGGFELRMELAGQEERMVDAFDDFHQVVVRIDAAGPDAPASYLSR